MSNQTNQNQIDEQKFSFIKAMPVMSLVFAIFLQTTIAIWWAATLTNKLDNINTQMIELKVEKYTSNDAKRDAALSKAVVDSLERRVTKVENYIDRKN